MQCTLNSIGNLKKTKGLHELIIDRNYVKGLKNIEMFSHILLIAATKGQGQNRFRIITAEIKDIDLLPGYFALRIEEKIESAAIYDLKPFIPCEDRVIGGVYPEKQSSIGALSHKEEITHEPAGRTDRIQGKQVLIIDDELHSQFKPGDYVRVVWWFSKFDKKAFRKTLQVNPPYEDAPKSGVFATRSPVRPNPIAITTAKILGISGSTIEISDIEAYNNTPVLDVLPYSSIDRNTEDIRVPKWMTHWQDHFKISSDISENNENKYIDINKYIECETENVTQDREISAENSDLNHIVVEGARQNNLKNVSVRIPKHKFTVVTGLSGSGKSSLAFDTIYAEAERRFTGSFSAAGSGVVPDKPDFDNITGLSPAIAIEQNRIIRNSRSTVGSLSGIYGLLRTLYSTFGTRFCEICGTQHHYYTVHDLINLGRKLKKNTDFKIVQGDKILIESVKKAVSGDLKALECELASKFETHHKLTLFFDDGTSVDVTDRKSCVECGNLFFDLKPYIFSSNNPEGMCPDCNGTGRMIKVEEESVINDPEKSILDGASAWWGDLRKFRDKPSANWMRGEVFALAAHFKIDLEKPWNDLPGDFRHKLLNGYRDEKVTFRYESASGRSGNISRYASGAITNIERLLAQNKESTNGMLGRFCIEKICPSCRGSKIGPVGRNVMLDGVYYTRIAESSISKLDYWCKKINSYKYKVIFEQIIEICTSISGAGLEYLTLDRPVPTLSGGEMQRLILSTRMHSGLTDLLYVLDEPSKGLHPYDYNKISQQVKRLADAGNTVVVVEHAEDIIRQADYVIDLGPESGVNGGEIVAQGSVQDIMAHPESITGGFLRESHFIASKNRQVNKKDIVSVKGACRNNLQNVDLNIPLGNIIAVTGVSGSGKSTLVYDVLGGAWKDFCTGKKSAGDYQSVSGFENVSKLVVIDQRPVWKSIRSNAATYLGVLDEVRKIFAAASEAKSRKYTDGMFSTNSPKGQCPVCKGLGFKKISLGFMSDVHIRCESCKGLRYKEEVLEIKYNGNSIADVLEMDVRQVVKLFQDNSKINDVLNCLIKLGLDYIKIGQSTATLSGGEAQRLKLAAELNSPDLKDALIILDEPTSGLHIADVQKFMDFIRAMNAQGATIIMIEHNMRVVAMSDWIIDMGPGGGINGGHIIAQGSIDEVMRINESFTAEYLREKTK